jgi:hypothetical protein
MDFDLGSFPNYRSVIIVGWVRGQANKPAFWKEIAMPQPIPLCRVTPLAGHQVAFEIDGVERLRWHFGAEHPRPFFYPLLGPSGAPLTRMGHPGAANHDHHRSIWFAHNKVLGIDFWSEGTSAHIRQKEWRVFEDGEDRAAMAVVLGWYDGHDPRPLLEQELIAIVRPAEPGETLLELQSTFRPEAAMLEFGQTNFGFLAVRVAKSISAHFGGGTLTNSEGQQGEPAIFGKPARWMDYSGAILIPGGGRNQAVEGITYFDHPANPNHPTRWHVREDGWMGASVCMEQPFLITRAHPLHLRYLLYAHSDAYNAARAETISQQFATWPRLKVTKSTRKHQQFELIAE